VKTLVALSRSLDLAVVRIDTTDTLPKPLDLDANVPSKGESVVALGAPRGLTGSASSGIVSAIRNGSELSSPDETIVGVLIQTTAPISPGNSGGPLLNAQGKVVGINTFVRTDGQNLNFAVASKEIATLLAGAKPRAFAGADGKPPEVKPEPPDPKSSLIAEAIVGFPPLPHSVDPLIIDSKPSKIKIVGVISADGNSLRPAASDIDSEKIRTGKLEVFVPAKLKALVEREGESTPREVGDARFDGKGRVLLRELWKQQSCYLAKERAIAVADGLLYRWLAAIATRNGPAIVEIKGQSRVLLAHVAVLFQPTERDRFSARMNARAAQLVRTREGLGRVNPESAVLEFFR
jgi:hypothetical protein